VVGAVEKVIPVDLHIRGCPPRPIELLRGLLALLEAVVGARHASPLSRLTPLRPGATHASPLRFRFAVRLRGNLHVKSGELINEAPGGVHPLGGLVE